MNSRNINLGLVYQQNIHLRSCKGPQTTIEHVKEETSVFQHNANTISWKDSFDEENSFVVVKVFHYQRGWCIFVYFKVNVGTMYCKCIKCNSVQNWNKMMCEKYDTKEYFISSPYLFLKNENNMYMWLSLFNH